MSRARSAKSWRPVALSIAVHAGLVVLVLGAASLTREPPPPMRMTIEAMVVPVSRLPGTPQPAAAALPPAEPEPLPEPESEIEPAPQAEPPAPVVPAPTAAPKLRPPPVVPPKPAPVAVPSARPAIVPTPAPAPREDPLRAARERELQQQMAAEERGASARAAGLGAEWAAAIQARIQRAWIRPPAALAGLDCTVDVTQVPGGAVVSVRVRNCNGDAAVRQSIEDAVYRASPLPSPPDPALFERNLEVRFRPND